MKKAILGVLTAVMVLSAGTMSVCAAGCRSGHHRAESSCYVDADSDGVCDICGADHGFCPGADGLCFTDADGDGICDNCEGYHSCSGTGSGRGCHGSAAGRPAGGGRQGGHRRGCRR